VFSPLRSCLRAILWSQISPFSRPSHEGREAPAYSGPGFHPAPRFCRRRSVTTKKLNYFLFRKRDHPDTQPHSSKAWSDGRGKPRRGAPRRSRTSERIRPRSAATERSASKPHIVAKPHPFQRGNEKPPLRENPPPRKTTPTFDGRPVTPANRSFPPTTIDCRHPARASTVLMPRAVVLNRNLRSRADRRRGLQTRPEAKHRLSLRSAPRA